MSCVRILSIVLIVGLGAGCSKTNGCPDPQSCLLEASALYQKAEAAQGKFEKHDSYKAACLKFFGTFQAQPDLFGDLQYKEAKWACFNAGDTSKTEALAAADEVFKSNKGKKKK